jgi:hypothetical protein
MVRDDRDTRSASMQRRDFLKVSGSFAAAVALVPWSALAESGASGAGKKFAIPSKLVAQLEKSPYVYISPLRSNGKESQCHAEVWYAWLDDAVVVTVAANRWKAKALAQGLDSAKIWVGDYGRVKSYGMSNDDYLKGQSFVARASKSSDESLMKRLIAAYETKYPAEIGKWRDKMLAGFADGSRSLLRYVPAS